MDGTDVMLYRKGKGKAKATGKVFVAKAATAHEKAGAAKAPRKVATLKKQPHQTIGLTTMAVTKPIVLGRLEEKESQTSTIGMRCASCFYLLVSPHQSKFSPKKLTT